MNKEGDKIQLYISKEWLKAFLILIAVVIVPYNIVIILLCKYELVSVQPGYSVAMLGTFAISFIWTILRRLRDVKNK